MTTATMPNGCAYCNGIHSTVCPRIAEIEYYPDGTIKHVVLRGLAPAAIHVLGPPDCPPTVTWVWQATTGETP